MVYATDEEEARQVAVRLRAAHHGDVSWSSMAVLYRTNAQSAGFEAALGASGIPYRVRGPGAFLGRPEVQAALDTLTAASRAAPGRRFAEHLVDLEAMAAETSGPESERAAHVEVLARLGREYLDAEAGSGSLEGFRAYLAAALRDDVPDGADGVELLSFHRAKGLEFHTVFVTGLERGLVPIGYADTPAARAEERRLLYVALSRAEEALHLSWARTRTIGSRVARRAPSPWLAPIEAGLGPADLGGGRYPPGRGDGREAAPGVGWGVPTRPAAARAHGVASPPGPGLGRAGVRDLPGRDPPRGGGHPADDPRRAPRAARGRPGQGAPSRACGPRPRPRAPLTSRSRRLGMRPSARRHR